MSDVIWVYLERDAGGITESSIQAVTSTRVVAQKTDSRVEGLCVGGDVGILKGLSGALNKIYHLVGDSLNEYTTDAYGKVLEAQVVEHKPAVLLFPSSTQGDDLASWLAAGLGVGVLLSARDFRREGGCVLASRVEFEGKVGVDYELKGAPVILSLAEGSAEQTAQSVDNSEIETVPVSIPSKASSIRVISTEVAKRTVNLREAPVVVGVGAGVGGGSTLELALDLAELLGGEVGATRAAVDAGWVSYDRQIGQTGMKVRPDLYVALGISGAVQHRVGILESGTIIAVNIDPYAPIFRFSHYCIEGDLKVVLPKLIQIIRR
jgi:electron transfer flavoprotein alpha subunit